MHTTHKGKSKGQLCSVVGTQVDRHLIFQKIRRCMHQNTLKHASQRWVNQPLYLLDFRDDPQFKSVLIFGQHFPNSSRQLGLRRRRDRQLSHLFRSSPRSITAKTVHPGVNFGRHLPGQQTKSEFWITVDQKHQIIFEQTQLKNTKNLLH
jgi:hypothetical protein